MRVSIILPVYNAAAYIGPCLDSIFLQTCSDLECIVIDDCGTDQSMRIVQDKLAAYNGSINFRIVNFDRNRGQSAARNAAIAIASGEYLMFVDSDDRLVTDCISSLVLLMESNQAELLCYAYDEEDQCVAPSRKSTSILDPASRTGSVTVYSGIEFLSKMTCSNSSYVMPWLYVMRRQFILDFSLRFLEGAVFEDEDFTHRALCLANKVVHYDNVCYVYTRRGDSTMRKPEWIAYRIASLRKVVRSLADFSVSIQLPVKAKDILNDRIAALARRCVNLCLSHSSRKDLEKVLAFTRKRGISVFSYPNEFRASESRVSVMLERAILYARVEKFRLKYRLGDMTRKLGY